MSQKVNINNNSISNTVTNDYRRAICEFIWNGFDANAIKVEINYNANELGNISSFSISDNGDGIDRSLLDETFGCYQDSIKKKTFQWSSQVKGKRGKGRFSFNCFASKAEWLSIYKEKNSNKLIQHKVSILRGSNDRYDDGGRNGKIVKGVETGTVVSFYDVTICKEYLEDERFIEYLRKEFAVFLLLNKNFSKQILINGEVLDYSPVIDMTDIHKISITDRHSDEIFEFSITFVRWKEKLKENYYAYFLDQNKYEKYEETTKLNNKDNEFHHSLYVESAFFDFFVYQEKGTNNKDLQGNRCQKDDVFVTLQSKLKEYLEEQRKEFICNVGSERLLKRYEHSGVIRQPKDEYDKLVIRDLKNIIKSIYSVQPKIFTNLENDQAKTLIGFLELLLQTDRRNDVLNIMEGIVTLSDEERQRLSKVLETTEWSYITDTIELLENRCKTISALKSAVYRTDLNVNEVNDLQKMVEKSFWIFGEEYNIVTEAEPDFQQALDRYIEKLHEHVPGKSKSIINKEKIEHPDVNKEMDLFAFRSTCYNDLIENIVVELKSPKIKLGEVECSQVKTYASVIASASEFNASNMRWKFFLIGKEYDSSKYIQREKKSNQTWGKSNLIQHVDDDDVHYEIFVLKWSDIFANFEIRHKFLLDRLKLKRDKLSVGKIVNKAELHDVIIS